MPYRELERSRGVSLRMRLSLWVVGLFVAISVVTSTVIYLYQWSTISDAFSRQLADRAGTIGTSAGPLLPYLQYRDLVQLTTAESAALTQLLTRVDVLDVSGESVVRSGLDWPEEVRQTARETARAGQQLQLNGARVPTGRISVDWFDRETSYRGPVRYVTTFVAGKVGDRYAMVLAAPDEFVSTQTSLVARLLLIAGVVSVCASAVSGWYIAGIAIEPLRRLRNVASQLGPESINKQLHVDSRSVEVSQLTVELDAARERIRQAFAAQERFLSNISHEIKTPIATLLIEAQTIDKQGLSKSGLMFVRTAEEEMRKLGKLVESFLTLTRIQDGKGLARMDRVMVNDIVLESVSHCTAQAKIHSVSLHPTLIEDDEYVDAVVSGDPDLLRTMVDNLVRNAIRFTPRDGRVVIAARVEDGKVKVAVEDEGPGLPPEMLTRIFDRFVQAPEEARKGRGHGLGLAIAQGVAELHGGMIRVENRSEVGARFTIELPLGVAAETAGA